MKRATRQTTRKAVASGASPGLVSLLYSGSVSSRSRGRAAVPGPSATGLNPGIGIYRGATKPKDSPPKPLPPAGPTSMDGISFDTHQNKYEHDIDSPPEAHQIFPVQAHQQPKKRKGRSQELAAARKAAIKKAPTSIASSSDTGSSSSSSSDDNVRDSILLVPDLTPEIPTPSPFEPHTTVPAAPAAPAAPAGAARDLVTSEPATKKKRKASSEISNPSQRQFITPTDKRKCRGIDEEGESWRTGAEMYKGSPPQDKMEDIQTTGKSPIEPESDKMSICSPDMTPARVEFLRKKQEEFEGMKRQIGDLTFQNVKIELERLERKGKCDLLQKQVKDLTEENMRWRTLTGIEPGSGVRPLIAFEKKLKDLTEENERLRKIKKETTNRLRPLAALLKVINDDFHVDRESDADYIHWKNILRD